MGHVWGGTKFVGSANISIDSVTKHTNNEPKETKQENQNQATILRLYTN